MLKTRISNQTNLEQSALSPAFQNIRTIAGLPVRTAVVYLSLFAAAFWFYSVSWPTAPVMLPDSRSYLKAAQDLSDFAIHELQERAPGYPLLLLLTGSTRSPERMLFFVSVLLHFASIWLLASVLYRAGIAEMMLILFSLVLLLPPYVESAAYVSSENLAEAMLSAGFASCVFWSLHKRTGWILISAITIGCAALTRPTYQVLAIAIAGYLLTVTFFMHWPWLKWKDAIKASLIIICGSAVIVGGYAFVNYRNFGYFTVSPKLGLTLSLKTVRFVERLPDEYAGIRAALLDARNAALLEGDHTGSMYIWKLAPELAGITGLSIPELSDYMLRVNLLLIEKAPLLYLQDVVFAFGTYWLPSSGLANMNSRSVQLFWAVIHFLLIGSFFVNALLLIGALIYVKMRERFAAPSKQLLVTEPPLVQCQGLLYGLAGTIVFYTVAISCLIEVGDPRYRVPTDPLIIFMLFLGTDLWRRFVGFPRTVLVRSEVGGN